MQSTFKTTRTVTIDRLSPTDNGRDLFRLGALIVGSGKTVDRNVVQVFNLNTPAAGEPLTPLTEITGVTIWGNVTGVVGAAYNMKARRLTRVGYDYLTATWNNYATGLQWATPGGDYTTPPTALEPTFPTATGDILITPGVANLLKLLSLTRDAISNQNGILALHWSISPPAPSASEHVTIKAAPETDADVLRLIVDYTTNQPDEIATPPASTLPALRGAPAAPPARGLPGARPAQPARGAHGR